MINWNWKIDIFAVVHEHEIAFVIIVVFHILIIIVFHILIWGAWGFVSRGEAHQSIPVATGQYPPELTISGETWNDLHIVSTGVKLH